MTPPGWYRDPWEPSANSGQLRWWDGLGWTSAIANPASAFSNPDPRKDFENEVKYGRWASRAHCWCRQLPAPLPFVCVPGFDVS